MICSIFKISVILAILGLSGEAFASSYHWPLGTEPALTSTFGEYREGRIWCHSGHLHSGIDLKTWERTGYEVFAVDSGWVWRVRASPWGYGKAVYLRLTDGKLAVYAHLSDFAPQIRRLVEEQQEKLGRYSVDIYPQPGTLRVKKGRLIGYSGETGSGGPHLHFEIRDAENRPLNPLINGFCIADTIPPIISKLSITPLDPSSTVNGEHSPAIIPLVRVNPNRYRTDEQVAVSGRIGFGVLAYDRANGSNDKFDVYNLELYIDGVLRFTAKYDSFSFENTHKADIDRDYRLIRWGWGKFHKLYQDVGNDLPFYGSGGIGYGVLDTFEPGKRGRRTLAPGVHQVKVIAKDTNANGSVAEARILIDEPPVLKSFSARKSRERVRLLAVAEDPDGRVERVAFDRSTDLGKSWEAMAMDSMASPGGTYQARLQAYRKEMVITRAQAVDGFGLFSTPKFAILKDGVRNPGDQQGPGFDCRVILRDGFVELDIRPDEILADEPRVTVIQVGEKPKRVKLIPKGVKRYTGTYRLIPGKDGLATVEIEGEDLWGNGGRAITGFVVNTIAVGKGGQASLPGKEVWAVFEPNSVYEDLFIRIKEAPVDPPLGMPPVSPAYSFHPMDIPFAGPVKVAIGYPPSTEELQKVGLYGYDDRVGWEYVGRQVDLEDGLISAGVSSFETFALLKDPILPEAWDLKPSNGSRIRDRRPTLFAKVKDQGSGIGSEEDVVMRLDGRRLISEYDPEKNTVKYRVKHPLSYGKHVLTVSVRDRAENKTVKRSVFWVVK